ncbi:WD40 repeat-like protein [Gonapodya prolifera JEL478]|uniref:WD40 repeat-like protein n=1 Tax=Gonapodya prolifera (strain JEL478) TaxID=1344416 RepID=A0A139A1V4_GONPJ|nr:WD40 repeat-like protein [Gonapodya prolifera JEL478]|eukprot:KXS10343.1 WD40 repeat-like protein [Gonapodya prolifera JEL478]
MLISMDADTDAADALPPKMAVVVGDWRKLTWAHALIERAWKRGKFEPNWILGHDDSVYCVQHDGTRIVSGSRDRTVRVWDARTHKPIRTLRVHDGSVLCLQYDATGSNLITGSSDTSLAVWNLQRGSLKRRLRGHTDAVLDVRLVDEGGLAASCSKDRSIRIWRLDKGDIVATMEGHSGVVNAISVSAPHLASASVDHTLKLWDLATASALRDFTGHEASLFCVHMTPDGHTILSGSRDCSVRVWDVRSGFNSGDCVRTLLGHENLVRTLAMDHVRGRCVSGSYDKSIKVWDLGMGKVVVDVQKAHPAWVYQVQVDATKIVSAGQEGKVVVWDFSGGVGDEHVDPTQA